MILLWLIVPLAITAMFMLMFLTEKSEFDEAARRAHALQKLEGKSGQGVSDDGDRSAGWFVSPDGRWPRRVRILRPERSAGSIRFEEPGTEDASTCAGPT